MVSSLTSLFALSFLTLVSTFGIFLFPMVIYILVLPLSVVSIYLFYNRFKVSTKINMTPFLIFLEKVNILDFFFRLFFAIWFKTSIRTFNLLFVGIYSSTLFYVTFARFYVLLAVTLSFSYLNSISLSCLSVLIYFTLLIHFLKLLFNASNILFVAAQEQESAFIERFLDSNLDLKALVLKTSELDFLSPKPQDLPQSQPRSVFAYNRIVNRYNILPSKFSFGQRVGLGVGICTLGVGCVAAVYSYWSYHKAVLQTEQAMLQTRSLERQADAAEVSAGLMSKDQFNSKWNPKN